MLLIPFPYLPAAEVKVKLKEYILTIAEHFSFPIQVTIIEMYALLSEALGLLYSFIQNCLTKTE